MQAVAGKSIEDLPLVDWVESSTNCGGDVRDDVFLVDLMVCFCTEGLPRVRRLLQAALAFRHGDQTFAAPGDAPRPIEVVIKDEAHALKGSAANVRLWRLAKACEDCELPCKALVQSSSSSSSPSAREALLTALCVHPRTLLSEVVHQFRALTLFLRHDMRSMEGVNLESALDPPTLVDLLSKCTPEYFDAEIAEDWDSFNALDEPVGEGVEEAAGQEEMRTGSPPPPPDAPQQVEGVAGSTAPAVDAVGAVGAVGAAPPLLGLPLLVTPPPPPDEPCRSDFHAAAAVAPEPAERAAPVGLPSASATDVEVDTSPVRSGGGTGGAS